MIEVISHKYGKSLRIFYALDVVKTDKQIYGLHYLLKFPSKNVW